MRLIEPLEIDKSEFKDFISEFKVVEENLIPYSLDQKDMDFQTYINSLIDESLGKGIPDDWVPASTYFLVNNRGKIYGAINIRHRLTDYLRIEGGHIGYGIRPSARNQGYGSKILKFALEKAYEMGLKKVLVVCDKDNVFSARIIQKNGGKLDSGINKDNTVQRYWIEL